MWMPQQGRAPLYLIKMRRLEEEIYKMPWTTVKMPGPPLLPSITVSLIIYLRLSTTINRRKEGSCGVQKFQVFQIFQISSTKAKQSSTKAKISSIKFQWIK